jgi:hypothetical protein
VSWEFIRWVWGWKRNHPEFVDSLRETLRDRPLFVVRSRRDAEDLLKTACQARPLPRI